MMDRAMSRARAGALVLAAGGAALVVSFAKMAPRDQTIHVVLGDAAPRVEEVDVRWADAARTRAGAQAAGEPADPAGDHRAGDGPGEGWLREATFRFAPGAAPRVVTEELRLVRGDYLVEVEVAPAGGPASFVRRRVSLEGGALSIDVSSALAFRASHAGRASLASAERASAREGPEAPSPTVRP